MTTEGTVVRQAQDLGARVANRVTVRYEHPIGVILVLTINREVVHRLLSGQRLEAADYIHGSSTVAYCTC